MAIISACINFTNFSYLSGKNVKSTHIILNRFESSKLVFIELLHYARSSNIYIYVLTFFSKKKYSRIIIVVRILDFLHIQTVYIIYTYIGMRWLFNILYKNQQRKFA